MNKNCSSIDDVNSVRIETLEQHFAEIKEKLISIEDKVHAIEAQMLVKEKISEAWIRNITILGGIVTTIGAFATVYYFLIKNIDAHLLSLIH